jgi:SAM-dependent methyltransferase
MFDLLGMKRGDRVLDVAAGAGEQTLLAAKRVGPMGKVLATDISPRILEFAAAAAKQAGFANVETRVLDGENLELEPNSFDVVISRVGLIYFPDQQKALRGMLAALKPGGRFGAIVYSTPENNRFFSTPVSIIRRRAQLPPPLPGQPGPFSLGQPGVLTTVLETAGFKNVATHVQPAPLRLANALECVRFEQESFGALHQMLASLDANGRQEAWDEIARELAAYETTNGFEGPCELAIGFGTK